MKQELSLPYAQNKLEMDIFYPENNRNGAAILFVHGGGWRVGKRQDWHTVMSYFCDLGYVCATPSYRLSGEAAYPAQIDDVTEAMQFFKNQAQRLRFDPDKVAALGSSAGGHLCLMLAMNRMQLQLRPACVVAMCPVSTLVGSNMYSMKFVQELIKQSYEQAPSKYQEASPDCNITEGLPPLLLIHGDHDSTIPYRNSIDFYEEYVKHNNEAELHILPGVEHGFGYATQKEYQIATLRMTENFLSRRLFVQTLPNLALGQRYRTSYPGLRGFSGDPANTVLTDGCIPQNGVGGEGWLKATLFDEIYTGKTFTGEKAELPTWEVGRPPHYSIVMDLGYVCNVQDVAVTFGRHEGGNIVLPEHVEVFLSDDGYNFTLYPRQWALTSGKEDIQTYFLVFDGVQPAKAAKVVVYTTVGVSTAMAEISIHGTALYQKTAVSLREDNRGYYGIQQPDYTDERTGTICSVLELDLGELRQVSEVRLETLVRPEATEEPRYIAVYTSGDENIQEDFGTSALQNCYGVSETDYTAVFMVTRNNTVAARRIRIHIYADAPFQLDSLEVFGSDTPVLEPAYSHVTKTVELPHTNVLEFHPLLVDGKSTDCLTDLVYMDEELSITKSNGKTVVEAELGKAYDRINSLALYFRTSASFGLPTTVKTYLAAENGDYQLVCDSYISHEVAERTVVRQLFGDHVATKIRVEIESDSPYMLTEMSAYNGQPQLPVIDGGFINPNFSNVSSNEGIAHLDDYMWYILLKGMKDLGMEHVVVHYTTNKKNMFTLIRGNKALEQLGYKELHIYNSKDPIEAIMKAADKLNIKVFVGTCVGVGFNRVPYDAYHEEVIQAAKITIDALAEQYGSHTSFYGYYFSDETCDAWLEMPGALEKFRHVYKSQSEYVRSRYPGKKTMICPAIWRSGTPESGANNMYELLRGDNAEDAPIVDIVAQQDCLGRTTDLVLPADIYVDFERHVEAWAKSVRAAGAEFWSDLEVFNSNIISKTIGDVIHGLEIESKYTNGNIVFDIVNYFCPLCQTGRVSPIYRGTYSWRYARQDYHMAQYVKYYHTRYAQANRWGADATEEDAVPVKLSQVLDIEKEA